ncbi:MAG: hypothetical protein AB2L18_10925 [Anaerolineaceae bacterium]
MKNNLLPFRILFILLVCSLFISACSSKIDSIPLTSAFPDATQTNIRSAYEQLGFTFGETRKYKGYELVTGVSPDGLASLQLLGTTEEVQAARILIYLSVDATNEYANQQYVYFEQIFSSVFADTWPAAEEWLITATSSISERNNTSLIGGASVTHQEATAAGDLPVSLYVLMDKDSEGFVMGVVVGDWLDDISYDPVQNVWKP